MTFDEAFTALLGHEGGYVNHPDDPGGETNWGISKRSYPAVDIKNLTRDQAKAIYLRDFWEPAGCDKLPDSIRFDVFDTAVNSGLGRAALCLQRAVRVKEDGRLGSVTLMAVAVATDLRAKFNGARLQFMADLPTWGVFGKGWARRVASNLLRD